MFKYFNYLLIVLLLSPTIYAGSSGKLTGYIKDQTTDEPLIGVNIIIEDTNLGAASDINGFYLVNNIPPGVYTVNYSAIGYQKKKIINVKISVDFTTEINVNLSSESIILETVVIEAETPLVRKDLTSSHVTIEGSQIQKLPVESLEQLLFLQAGVTQGIDGDIHIRGGRSNEIAYSVNGVSISNPFDNSATIKIAINAIHELSVISGTFNAEYGNALSGIVNSITKEGGSIYHGEISVYSGDYFSERQKPFTNINSLNPIENHVGEITFGGPVPSLKDFLTFFLSGRYEYDNGWLFGIREHTIYDSVYINPANPNDVRISSTGNSRIVSMNPQKNISSTSKLTFKPWSTFKINHDFFYSESEFQLYSHDFKYNPDANYTYREKGFLHSLEIRHAISSQTFYSLKGWYNIHNYSKYLFPLLGNENKATEFYAGKSLHEFHPDPRHQPVHKLTRPTAYTFYYGGSLNDHTYERSQTLASKFDITSQISKNHELKFGITGKTHSLDYETFTVLRDSTRYLTPTIPDVTTPDHDLYNKKPIEFSAFIQDKIEYENIILNIGFRYDYFKARSQYSTNINYPSPKDPGLPDNINKTSLLAEASPKHQYSPRIGVSFPITDQGIIHFSYGHFFQMPPFQFLYSNADFKYSLASGRQLFGNANLNPEKTVTYELGLQQQLTDNIAFNITGFYKDVRDLLAAQVIRVSGDKTYIKYINKDYGNIKGITFSLVKRMTKNNLLGANLDYTFQVAEGNDTNPDAFFLDLSSGRQKENIVTYLPWDQTHTLNLTISIGEDRNWYSSFIGKLGTGLPYTPQILEQQIYVKTNSGRRPSTFTVDFFAEKIFQILNYQLVFFVKAYNLFDKLNERLVYDDTGRASYSLLQTSGGTKSTDDLAARVPGIKSSEDFFQRPDYYYPPRKLSFGISFEF